MCICNATTRGYLNTSHLQMYIKSIKDIKKYYVRMTQKREKNSIRNGRFFNKLTEVNKLLVSLHLHMNEENL